MAAPDLARRTTVFVAKIGTDDLTANFVGAPQPRLTIAQALSDLANNYDPATIDAIKVISIEPGVYITPAFELPPNVFIEADPDAEGGSNGQVIIQLTGNISLGDEWQNNADAIGGFRGVTITPQEGPEAIAFTLPAPVAGTPNRTLILENVKMGVAAFTAEGWTGNDALQIRDLQYLNFDGATTISGLNVTVAGFQTNAAMVFQDTVNSGTVIYGQGIYMIPDDPEDTPPGVTFQSSNSRVGARLGACTIGQMTLDLSGTGALAIFADAVSIPLANLITYAGSATTANLIRTTDSGAIAGAVASVGGSFAMVGGVASVGNVAVLVSSGIVLTRRTASGAATGTFLVTVTPGGGGFTVAGGAVTDNGTYNYKVLN